MPTLNVLGLVQVVRWRARPRSPSRSAVTRSVGRDIALGSAAGSLNVIALGCLYAGLATGRMGIVAPVTATIAACIPVIWGLANGEDLTALSLAGVVLAICAGGLIARERSVVGETGRARALLLALGAGLLFGTSLVLYSETGHDSGAWPVLAGRTSAAVIVLVAVVAVLRGSLVSRHRSGGWRWGPACSTSPRRRCS